MQALMPGLEEGRCSVQDLCDYEVERLKQNKEQFQTNIEICISSLSIIHCADGIQQEPQ